MARQDAARGQDPAVDQASRLRDGEADFAIRRQSLHGSVADHVRAMIIRGDLAAGEKVPTQTLAQSLGVSITPLREALKILAEEQLIELLPNRGARVLPFTADEAVLLFEVIASLEGLAAELAAARITAEALSAVESLHARMRSHFEAREKAPYFALNSRIHEEILAAAANPVLVSAHARLNVRAARGRYIAIIDQSRWSEAMSEHEDLMIALRERDAARAGAIWRGHLLRTGAAVRRAQIEGAAGPLHLHGNDDR
jgi:DNA-binding GntR family transcriptional regulator